MSRTVTVVTGGCRTEVVFCVASASVLTSVWLAEGNIVQCAVVEPLSSTIVASINWYDWKANGVIQVTESDTINFESKTTYDGDESKLEELVFTTNDGSNIEFTRADFKFLTDIIISKLHSEYNPEIYLTWREISEDKSHWLQEDEVTGN